MAKKAESRRQQNIKKKLKARCGGKWWKVHGSSFQEAGMPDIDGVCQGISFKFEVKEPLTGEPSDIQLETLAEWREAGAIACIVETPEQAITLVEAAIASSANRHRGDRLYRWICRTLRAAYGEDLGYGRSPRGRKGRQPRRSARWAVDQFRKHMGKVPGGEARMVLGAP